MRRLASKLLILTGIICYLLTVYFVFERTNPRRVAFDSKKYEATYAVKKKASFPVKITLPDQSIDLPVIPAQIQDGRWDATTEGVSYLITSPIPGEVGNSILYGHNWSNLVGRLVNSKPGQVIYISYKDGSKKAFEIEYTVTVTPDQTHILEASDDKRITIYTCTGFLDSQRFVAVALLREDKADNEKDNLTVKAGNLK